MPPTDLQDDLLAFENLVPRITILCHENELYGTDTRYKQLDLGFKLDEIPHQRSAPLSLRTWTL